MHRIKRVLAWAPAGEGFRRLALLAGIAGGLFWTASVVGWPRPALGDRLAAALPLERLGWTLGCAKPYQAALEEQRRDLERELGRPITPGDTAAINALAYVRGETTLRAISGFDRPLLLRLMAIRRVDYECRQVPFLLGRAAFWLLWLPVAFLLPWGVVQVVPLTIGWVVAGFQKRG